MDLSANTKRLLSPIEAAERLNVSASTLAKQRVRGDGPKFVKIGSRVSYRPEDVEAYIESRVRRSTSGGQT